MNEVANLPSADRAVIFTESANRRGLNASVIEKDFWVCWTLYQLFALPAVSEHFIFKGGTSLSKVYNLINRFSEDIDIAIDKSYLGYPEEYDLRAFSVKERDAIVTDLDRRCREIVQGEIFGALEKAFSAALGASQESGWHLSIDPADVFGQTILFSYPREAATGSGIAYIKPVVRIELGARPENQPAERHLVTPYAAEDFPDFFATASSEITVLALERTFWEKATILHDQFHRDDGYKTADRISRHYYDFYQLAKAGITEKALASVEVLESVVVNKKSFFYRAGAKYEEVLAGDLHLIPSPARIALLKKDYQNMSSMFFSAPPDFDEILKFIGSVERRINARIG